MCLWIHTDASYLSESEARSRAGSFFYLSTYPQGNPPRPPPINGPIHVVSTIMKNVMASAAEAEVGAAYIAAQEGCPLRQTLIEMGHPQPATPLQTDNIIAKGIIDGTVKQKRSKAIDMRFYWLQDRQTQDQYAIYWRKGSTNLGNYFTKHFSPAIHRAERPIYLWTDKSKAARETYIRFTEQENKEPPNQTHTSPVSIVRSPPRQGTSIATKPGHTTESGRTEHALTAASTVRVCYSGEPNLTLAPVTTMSQCPNGTHGTGTEYQYDSPRTIPVHASHLSVPPCLDKSCPYVS